VYHSEEIRKTQFASAVRKCAGPGRQHGACEAEACGHTLVDVDYRQGQRLSELHCA